MLVPRLKIESSVPGRPAVRSFVQDSIRPSKSALTLLIRIRILCVCVGELCALRQPFLVRPTKLRMARAMLELEVPHPTSSLPPLCIHSLTPLTIRDA